MGFFVTIQKRYSVAEFLLETLKRIEGIFFTVVSGIKNFRRLSWNEKYIYEYIEQLWKKIIILQKIYFR